MQGRLTALLVGGGGLVAGILMNGIECLVDFKGKSWNNSDSLTWISSERSVPLLLQLMIRMSSANDNDVVLASIFFGNIETVQALCKKKVSILAA
jgi:hypothetical protein